VGAGDGTHSFGSSAGPYGLGKLCTLSGISRKIRERYERQNKREWRFGDYKLQEWQNAINDNKLISKLFHYWSTTEPMSAKNCSAKEKKFWRNWIRRFLLLRISENYHYRLLWSLQNF